MNIKKKKKIRTKSLLHRMTADLFLSFFFLFLIPENLPQFTKICKTTYGTLDAYGKELFARFRITEHFHEDTSFLLRKKQLPRKSLYNFYTLNTASYRKNEIIRKKSSAYIIFNLNLFFKISTFRIFISFANRFFIPCINFKRVKEFLP